MFVIYFGKMKVYVVPKVMFASQKIWKEMQVKENREENVKELQMKLKSINYCYMLL